DAEAGFSPGSRCDIRSENSRMRGGIARKSLRRSLAVHVHFAHRVLHGPEVAQPSQVNRETLFLIHHEWRIFEGKLALICPDSSLEGCGGVRFSSLWRRLRTARATCDRAYRDDHVQFFHGRTSRADNSSPTTRSSSMSASLTAA